MFLCDPALKPARAEGRRVSKLATEAKEPTEDSIVKAMEQRVHTGKEGWEMVMSTDKKGTH